MFIIIFPVLEDKGLNRKCRKGDEFDLSHFNITPTLRIS